MLQFYEEYAKDHDMLFNADKSIISRPRGVASGGNRNRDICFSISGNVIENVESWPHLGHVITNNASDKLDVLSRHGSFIGQVNNVICWFSKLDCCMKTRLLRVYCFSFYGRELWDLSNLHVQSLCVAGRQTLRRIWKLPYNCHTAIIVSRIRATIRERRRLKLRVLTDPMYAKSTDFVCVNNARFMTVSVVANDRGIHCATGH